MTNPVQARTVQLTANTENVQSGDVVFHVSWLRDHDDWRGRLEKTRSHVDPRHIPECAFPIQGPVAGNETTINWDVTWSAIDLGNNEIEIYAVIRAEYRFIKDNGWCKIAAKKASQGIDSLFTKGSGERLKYAMVESKCTRNTALYEWWVTGPTSQSPLDRLGTPMGQSTDWVGPMSANGVRQMSRPWILHAFLQECRGDPDDDVQDSLRGLRQWMCERKRMPQLWLNVYGAPRVPPGGVARLYLLPGVYSVQSRVGPLNEPDEAPNNPEDGANDAISGPLRANWGDEEYRPLEFFSLDARTTRSPGITGDFHDYSRQFREICADDQIDDEVVQEVEREVNILYEL